MLSKAILLIVTLNSSDTLPYRDSLFTSLRRFHSEQLQTDLSEFQVQEKNTWMKYVPTVGLGFNVFSDKIRPTVSYSLSQVFQSKNEKDMRQAKIQKILRGSALAFKKDSFDLVEKLAILETVKRSVAHLETVQAIEDEEFKLQEERNAKGEILPVNWISIRLQHAKSSEAYWKELERLDLLILEIFKLAKF